MKTIIILLLLCIFSEAEQQSWAEFRKEFEKDSWNERWQKIANKAPELETEQRVEFLSKVLVTDWEDVGSEHWDTYNRVRTILLETEGHAKFYGDKMKANPRSGDRRYWFQYLKNMPSPETVAVLGELLADDSERPVLAEDGSNADWYLRMRRQTTPNCDRAISALLHLLDNPPVPAISLTYNHNEDTLKAWRLWYENVKAGRQTFRFKGDPVEYTLRGPSKRGAVEPNTSRRGKRNVPEAGQDEIDSPGDSRFSGPIIGAVLAGLFLVAGFFVYRRKQAEG